MLPESYHRSPSVGLPGADPATLYWSEKLLTLAILVATELTLVTLVDTVVTLALTPATVVILPLLPATVFIFVIAPATVSMLLPDEDVKDSDTRPKSSAYVSSPATISMLSSLPEQQLCWYYYLQLR